MADDIGQAPQANQPQIGNQQPQNGADQQGQQQGQQQQQRPPLQPQPQKPQQPKPVAGFEYSQIYYFRYNPKTIETIHIYDQYPLVIFMDIRGTTALGLNLHWIPGPLRNKMIKVITEMRNRSINESVFRLWYNNIKLNPPLHFALQAVRRYYISHCTNIKQVPDTWETLPWTHGSLYRPRYLQRSVYNPVRHIVQKGRRLRP